ncbi:MAG: D-2-hydroxyacid dehydrogenase [Chloroflexi bacterium]|nr:D-2-hydroxyacid dehydrogenase [Chloroflexota bacterium]
MKILIAHRFTEEQLARLRAVAPNITLAQKTFDGASANDPAALFDGDEEIFYGFIPPRDLARAPRLKWAQLLSAGVNRLQDHPLVNTNILITNSSGIHAIPIGEFSIALLRALARRVPRLLHFQTRAEWARQAFRDLRGVELHGKTIGVIGYGSIGRHAARIAKNGFQMRVLALTRTGVKQDRGYIEAGTGDPRGEIPDAWFTPAQTRDLLAQSDFVLVAAPLTNESRGMIGENELRAMKASAFIVNIARGEIIDERALIRALKENWIAGAGLDVFAHEPLPQESELWAMENVILSPHVSAATPHYNDRALALFAENLRRYIGGEELLNLVSKENGY